jgi:hypothetical protein
VLAKVDDRSLIVVARGKVERPQAALGLCWQQPDDDNRPRMRRSQ